MFPEELETQLQSLLSKYDFREDCLVVSDEDSDRIKLALYQSIDVLKDTSKISENLKQLLIHASMAVVEDELKTLFKKHDCLKEFCYLFVNNYSSLNDLIYSMLNEPEAVSRTLGLPLTADLEVLLKHDYETRVHLILFTRSENLSQELLLFLTLYSNMAELCSTTWSDLNNTMDMLKVTEDENRAIMKYLWGQHNDFRRKLCDNDFSGALIDELESKGGYKYLETLGERERHELKERYQLTERQLNVLAFGNKDSECQLLIDLITKASTSLTSIENGCNKVQSIKELNELCDILHWKCELLPEEKVIQANRSMLDQALIILQTKQEDRIEKHKNLIAMLEDESAFHGLCLGFEKEDWCYKAHSPCLLEPDVCNKLTEAIESCRMKNFCFSNKIEARKFEKVIFEMGMNAAETFANQYDSYFDETNLGGTSSSITILCFRSYPMASFQLMEDKRHLNLTPKAENALIKVCDERSAAGFLYDYGSHLLDSAQQLGGMTCHSIEISLPTEETKESLREIACQLLEKGLTEFLFLPNAQKLANMNCEISGTTVNVTCIFEAKFKGLHRISQPQLYGKLIKFCDLQQSALIERNMMTNANLYGIWKWISDKMPNMKQQSELLRNAWLRQARGCGIAVDMVLREIEKTEEDYTEELIEKNKIEIESSLTQLNLFDLNSTIEDEKLLKALRNFFASIQEGEHLYENEGLIPNPWIKYVGKSKEFKEFLVKFSRAWDESYKRASAATFQLNESLTFLRERLNDDRVSSALNKASYLQDTEIKKMLLDAKLSAKSQAFNKRIKQVTIENLVETLIAELEESCQTDAKSSLSSVQWRVSSLLKQALQSDKTSRWGHAIEDMLAANYGWRSGTFPIKLTADALHSVASSIRCIISENESTYEHDELLEVVQRTEPIELSSMTLLNETTKRNAAVKKKKKSFKPYDSACLERAMQSKMRKKRPFSDFLIDSPLEMIHENETIERRRLIIRRLRHRMDLSRSINEAKDQSSKKSYYETICEIIDEYDPNGIFEIYNLLLERRYTLPLFNPLTREQYLKLLREVSISISSSKPPIRLGDDVTLLRVVLISCREPTESQTHEILRSVFHVNTLHANDVVDGTVIDQNLTIDLGIGHVEQRRASESPLTVLIVHITGDYIAAMSFVREFADVLFVEDAPPSNGASSFCSCISKLQKDSLEDIVEVIRWAPSCGGFFTSQRHANLEKHGFSHFSIEAPNGDRLYNEIVSALHSPVIDVQRQRKPLHSLDLLGTEITYPVKGIVPFHIDKLLQDHLKNVAQTRSSFILQNNFRHQHKHEERKIEHRNDESERKKAEAEIEKCVIDRKNNSEKVSKFPLLTFFLQLLEHSDSSVRVMAIHKFSQDISTRTEIELEKMHKEIDKYHKLITNNASENTSEKELKANKQKYIDAKQKYQDAMLHIEHLWRELSHIYAVNPNKSKYRHLPRLAAQHLLDGFSIELLDGDANLLNLTWIHAVFNDLHNLIDQEKQRIFVLSVMGVQSSGKSTLLNTMFGIKMRTSVGQCTRGINMQLLQVEGRSEYDYILILDTEGTRSPDFHGMEGNEKRDNQMATLSILLADATIIVNPGENDAATKEILPIVLMAYQGSKLAEDSGGQLSSMMFFVYNRIDTTQKEKLSNIVQTLAQSLLGAFKTVQEIGGSVASLGAQEISNCLFRHFTLDASNSSSSDVRILGQNKRSYEPPENVPDPRYGETLVEFREHIHQRVTQTRRGATWKSRSLAQLSNYIGNVWQCICSADFTLRFAHVVEKSAFDQLELEYQRCEKDMVSLYQAKFSELRKSMLKERGSVDIGNSTAITRLRDDFQRRLGDAVEERMLNQDANVGQILKKKCYEKWKVSYEQRWDLSKGNQLEYWVRQVKYSFDMIFLYESEVTKLKREMRQQIREKFLGSTQEELPRLSENQLRKDYEHLIANFTKTAYDNYPPLNVKEAIDNIYRRNPTIKGYQINVFNETTELTCKNLSENHRDGGVSSASKTVSVPYKERFMNPFRSLPSFANWRIKHEQQQQQAKGHTSRSFTSADDAILRYIHEKIKTLLEGVERYDDGIVSNVIMETDCVLKTTNQKKTGDSINYSSRESAHIYARITLTYYLEIIQTNWERNNSVVARFMESKNMEEMHRYFEMVLTGAEKINLFRFRLQNKFRDLSEAFEAEMVCLTSQRVKEKNWLYEIKWTQKYMDRYLLELIDKNEISNLIFFVENPNRLFNVVMKRLVTQISKGLLTTGRGWREFIDHVCEAVKLATEKALSLKTNKAAVFVNELQTRLVDTLKADVLPRSIELDFDQDYTIIDSEKDDDFRDAVETKLLKTIVNQFEPSDTIKFSQKVADLALKQLKAENQPGAMPRCDAFCPWCKSTCTGKAGHDPVQQKHDTIHQPSGLANVVEQGSNALASDICSSYQDSTKLYVGDDEFFFRDWCKAFPDWEKPRPTQEWPLREYIFYNYHKDFAKRYGRLPSRNVPESFNRDLNFIRETLERGPVGF